MYGFLLHHNLIYCFENVCKVQITEGSELSSVANLLPSENRTKRAVIWRCKNLKRDSQPSSFILGEGDQIILKSRSSFKAVGPGGISILMLSKLDVMGLNYLTHINTQNFNQLWSTIKNISCFKGGKSHPGMAINDIYCRDTNKCATQFYRRNIKHSRTK